VQFGVFTVGDAMDAATMLLLAAMAAVEIPALAERRR